MRFCQSTSILTRTFLDEVLIASLDEPEMGHLNGTARVVWDALAVPRSLEEITGLLAREYEVGVKQIAPDVKSLIAELVGRGWVEESSGGSH
jgi:hypothetical protein